MGAPSVQGQAEVIARALTMAQIEPDTVSYVEAHGTGTPLGDPIEIEALRQVYGTESACGDCAIGSVKTNIGHLDAAAGIAGLIKTILALRHLWLNAWGVSLDPKRWKADKLFSPTWRCSPI